MRNITTLLLFLLFLLCHGVAGFFFLEDEELPERRERTSSRSSSSSSSDKLFLLQNSKTVVKTDAGEMRLLRNNEDGDKTLDRRMHIGFFNMEPRSLFIPQYLDSNLIIFVRRGEAKLGFIYGDELEERRLKTGDLYVIPAGSAFYLVNVGKGQRLHVICSIDPSTSLGDTFQPFYIGGGDKAQSILAGFEPVILETAFNESRTKLRRIFTKNLDGPIVYVDDSHAPNLWTKFLQLKKEEKVQHLKKMVRGQEEQQSKEEEKEYEEEEEHTSWSWRKLFKRVMEKENKKIENKDSADSPDTYNLYDRKPDFRNAYGWSSALDGSDYPPLKIPDIGVFHVNLTAGSMMAPHVNPKATEYGIVLRGYGKIQVLFPNGSNAMDTEIKVGDVFFVPRYFPFCQIASRNGPLEFFGFSTSAKKNRPQFLVGAVSLLKTMMGPELAAAFGVSEETMRQVVDAQHEVVILPSTWAAPPETGGEGKEEVQVEKPKGIDINELVNDVVMDVF